MRAKEMGKSGYTEHECNKVLNLFEIKGKIKLLFTQTPAESYCRTNDRQGPLIQFVNTYAHIICDECMAHVSTLLDLSK